MPETVPEEETDAVRVTLSVAVLDGDWDELLDRVTESEGVVDRVNDAVGDRVGVTDIDALEERVAVCEVVTDTEDELDQVLLKVGV